MKLTLKKLFPFILILSLLLAGCASLTDSPASTAGYPDTAGPADGKDASVTVHFIDVGQGDSIFIQSGSESMLIDAGTNESGPVVTQYLNSLGITQLDWVIGTHPHEDHIGGLDDVIEAFDTDRIMMPPKEHTTKTFEDVLDAVEAKGLSLTMPEAGDTYSLGSCEFTILGPVSDYGDELNDWSIVLRLDCGDTSFLFTGDAEKTAEADILSQDLPVKATLLKAGHHGSDTSTSDDFLAAVAPEFIVISAGLDNDYGHPHQSTLDKLAKAGTEVYRTDLSGTVIVSSDGTALSFKTEKDSPSSDSTSSDSTSSNSTSSDSISTDVHITKTGKTYHKAGCSALSKSDIIISLADARAKGYVPCKLCNPPD